MRILWVPVALCLVAGALGQRSITNEDDIEALQPLRDTIKKSNLDLGGWLNKKSKDPCGANTCGVDFGNGTNDTPPCAWEGLACLDGRVVGIEITGSVRGWLGGTLPSTLPSKLRKLELRSNQLEGRLQGAICTLGSTTTCQDRWNNLRDLEVVDMGFNNITGGLPEWSQLRSLQSLRLKNNQLTGALPSQWTSFVQIQDLDLSHNQLGGELPRSWGELPRLKRLNLAANMLSNAIPETWANMSRLEQLDLTANCAICGDVKGRVPPDVYASGLLARDTNLRKSCDSCDGCECDSIPLGLFKHALISFSVLLGVLLLVCLRKLCVKARDPSPEPNGIAPALAPYPQWGTPTDFEKTAVIVMPDGKEVCMGKQVECDRAYESSIDFPDTDTMSESSSDDDGVDEDRGDEGGTTSITFAPPPAQFGAMTPAFHPRGLRTGTSTGMSSQNGGSSDDSDDDDDYGSEESDVESPSDVRFSLSGLVPGAGVLAQGSQGERFDRSMRGAAADPAQSQGPSSSFGQNVHQDPGQHFPDVRIPSMQGLPPPPRSQRSQRSVGSAGDDVNSLNSREEPASGRSSARSHMALIASSKDKYFRQSLPRGSDRPRRRRSRNQPRGPAGISIGYPPGLSLRSSPSHHGSHARESPMGQSPRGVPGESPRPLSQRSLASDYAEELRSLSPGRRRRMVVSRLKQDEA